jgi:predicted metalloprotease
MEWTPDNSNQDIEDRRDSSGGGDGGPGFGGFGFGHIGIGGLLIVGLLSLVFHQNFFALLSGGGSQTNPGASYPSQQMQPAPNPAQDQAESRDRALIGTVYHDIEARWATILPAQTNARYHSPTLVLYRVYTNSGCGAAQQATGPFYCPEDEKIYLDLGFFDELKSRFGGSNGDFAQSYVIAHEFGHHIQKLLGTEQKVTEAQERNPRQRNTLSVDLELQADCYAGVWGYAAKEKFKLNQSDMQDALSAAAAVGDDHLQKMATGRVSPETWTHGSSAAREQWFTKGFTTGQVAACNTFGGQ